MGQGYITVVAYGYSTGQEIPYFYGP